MIISVQIFGRHNTFHVTHSLENQFTLLSRIRWGETCVYGFRCMINSSNNQRRTSRASGSTRPHQCRPRSHHRRHRQHRCLGPQDGYLIPLRTMTTFFK